MSTPLDATTSATTPPERPPAAAATTGVVSVVGFLVVLEFASGALQGWITPLVTSILQRYTLTAAEANWINVVYLLSTAVCLPLLAKLGDVHGHRRMLVVAATSVAAGSVLVAVAPTFGVFLLGRALQGPLLAFLPLEFAIVRERAGDRTGRAVGLLVGALAVGGGLGLLLAGVLRQNLSLTATLWIPAVVLILTVPVAAFLVPETTTRATGGVDWPGVALLSAGLALALVAIGNGSTWGWLDARTVGGLAGGVAVLVLWVAVEQRTAVPLVDLSLVRHGGLGLPMVAGVLTGAELLGSQTVSAVFLGLPARTGGLGLTPVQISEVFFAFGAAAFAGTVVAPRLAERAGNRTALGTGAALTALGYLLTALAHGSAGEFLVWQILIGAGNGLVLASLSTIVVALAPRDAVGIASGLFTTARTVGGALAGAVFASVLAAAAVRVAGFPKPVAPASSYVTVWVICAVLTAAVAVLASRLPADPAPPAVIKE